MKGVTQQCLKHIPHFRIERSTYCPVFLSSYFIRPLWCGCVSVLRVVALHTQRTSTSHLGQFCNVAHDKCILIHEWVARGKVCHHIIADVILGVPGTMMMMMGKMVGDIFLHFVLVRCTCVYFLSSSSVRRRTSPNDMREDQQDGHPWM